MRELEEQYLIAKFEGYSYDSIENEIFNLVHWEQHNYSEDWNQLIRVVEKIESLGAVDVIIGRYDCIITADDGTAYFKDTLSRGRSKIEMVYDSVVHFITWYNESRTK